jgi:hypothetical protein
MEKNKERALLVAIGGVLGYFLSDQKMIKKIISGIKEFIGKDEPENEEAEDEK